MQSTKYALFSSAKDEEDLILGTIESVAKQTIKPLKWIIVSDGSKDNTDKIIKERAEKYGFIEYVRKESSQVGFISKVNALNMAYEKLKPLDFDFVGNLDSDVTFPEDYFETLLKKFNKCDKLGITGGVIWEKIKGGFTEQIISLTSVPGAIQFFRRRCFDDVGGYLPLPYGGEDGTYEVMARMNGWIVRAFREIKVYHHRPAGQGNLFNMGKRFYYMGYSFPFEFFRCLSRIRRKPFFIGAIAELLVFLKLFITRQERHIPSDVVEYLHKEQYARICSVFKKNQEDPFNV